MPNQIQTNAATSTPTERRLCLFKVEVDDVSYAENPYTEQGDTGFFMYLSPRQRRHLTPEGNMDAHRLMERIRHGVQVATTVSATGKPHPAAHDVTNCVETADATTSDPQEWVHAVLPELGKHGLLDVVYEHAGLSAVYGIHATHTNFKAVPLALTTPYLMDGLAWLDTIHGLSPEQQADQPQLTTAMRAAAWIDAAIAEFSTWAFNAGRYRAEVLVADQPLSQEVGRRVDAGERLDDVIKSLHVDAEDFTCSEGDYVGWGIDIPSPAQDYIAALQPPVKPKQYKCRSHRRRDTTPAPKTHYVSGEHEAVRSVLLELSVDPATLPEGLDHATAQIVRSATPYVWVWLTLPISERSGTQFPMPLSFTDSRA